MQILIFGHYSLIGPHCIIDSYIHTLLIHIALIRNPRPFAPKKVGVSCEKPLRSDYHRRKASLRDAHCRYC